MTKHREPTFVPGQGWVTIAVVVGICLVILTFVLPAILDAREAARMVQSKNNLKQFALAFHNYHDVYQVLPIGGDIDTDGTAKHSWFTRCIPYLMSTCLYSWIDHDVAWNHPINESIFRHEFDAARIPGAAQTVTTEGHSLLHYMANPNAMHRNSSVALDQMTSGSGHNWLLGEVSGHYQPWGYPFNWRKLSLPFNAGPESYGQPSGNGVQLALADGSVIMLANKADSQIVDSLATSPPVAEPGKTSIPDVEFRYTKSHAAESVSLGSGELPDWPDAALTATIWIDSHGHPFAVFVACWSKGNCPDMTVQHLHMLAEQYPETQTLIMPRMSLGDEHVIELPLFSKLKVLSIAEIRLTEQGFSALQQLKTLRHLIVRAEDSELRKLRTALPDCEFTLR